MLGAGTRQSDQTRIKDDLLIKDTPPAPLYVLRKDHKVTPDPIIGPPTRPVCGANQSGYYETNLPNEPGHLRGMERQ